MQQPFSNLKDDTYQVNMRQSKGTTSVVVVVIHFLSVVSVIHTWKAQQYSRPTRQARLGRWCHCPACSAAHCPCDSSSSGRSGSAARTSGTAQCCSRELAAVHCPAELALPNASRLTLLHAGLARLAPLSPQAPQRAAVSWGSGHPGGCAESSPNPEIQRECWSNSSRYGHRTIKYQDAIQSTYTEWSHDY